MKYNFSPYLNNIFIETGSADGTGILAALRCKFPVIHSIELSEYYYNYCCKKFAKRTRRVKLHLGDSRMVLPKILKDINEPCTFWLDAHFCGGETAGKGGDIPIMEELILIRNHHIKTHTILIDDMRLIRNKIEEWRYFEYCICDLEEFIHTINANYVITYDEGVTSDDILVAQIK